MTLVNIEGGIPYPRDPASASGAPSYATGLLTNAAGEKAAFIFQAPKTGNIDRIGFRTATYSAGSPVDVRLETFTTSTGDPSGTLVGTNTNGSQTVSAANTWYETTLTASASVTEGTYYAIVLVPSGTPNMSFSSFADDLAIGLPESMLYTTSWAFYTGGSPVCSIRYDDGTYPPIVGISPFSAISTHTFNSGSTPDVYANKFTPPMSCSINGVWVWGDIDGDANIKVYDSDGVTVLASANLYLNVPKVASQSINFVTFASINLTAGSTYYIGVEASTATSLSLHSYEAPSADVLKQFPNSAHCIYSTAKDPTGTGSWTDNTSRVLTLGVLIDKLDDGAGGGAITRSVIY